MKYGSIVVIDLEATCWAGHDNIGSEIIQIGAVLLDIKGLEIAREFCRFVKPDHSDVSAFCTELTGIVPEDLRGASPLDHVLNALRNEMGTFARPWGSWGDYDRAMLSRQCLNKGCNYPMRGHLNIKALEAFARGSVKGRGMGTAAQDWCCGFKGTQHNALDDARNAAMVLMEILRRIRERR